MVAAIYLSLLCIFVALLRVEGNLLCLTAILTLVRAKLRIHTQFGSA